MIELKILDSVSDISKFTYKKLVEAGPTGSVALSFGSTYSSIFKNWKLFVSDSLQSDALKAKAECLKLPAFFPVDERMVDIDNPDSNWGTFSNLFLSVCGNDSDLKRHPTTVVGYQKILSAYFTSYPVFDIVFLGMGSDGHTASLFPDTCPDESDKNWKAEVLQTLSPLDPPRRLSLGPEVIAVSRQLIMLVTGKAKKAILEKFLLQLSNNDSRIKTTPLLPPVKIIQRREALSLNTLVITDKDAGENLSIEVKKGYIK